MFQARFAKRLWHCCALVVAALVVGGPARADLIRHWQNGEWNMAAYANNATKVFDDCRATRWTDSGGSFSMAQSRTQAWILVFATQTPMQMPVGASITVVLRVDGTTRNLLNAHVSGPSMVQFAPSPDSDVLALIRGGGSLSFELPDGHRGVVKLDGLTRATADVVQCVQTQLGGQRPAMPPADTASQPPQQTAGQQAAGQQAVGQPAAGQSAQAAIAASQLELAATRIASNLLLQAKLPNGRLLNPIEIPPQLKGFGAAWSSDSGFGSVMVLPNQPGKDVQHVALETIIGGANACKGDFAAGRATSLVDDTLVTKAFTACSDSGGTHSLRFFILHRETSWYVVYVIIPPANAQGGGMTQASQPGPLEDQTFQSYAVKAALYQ